jgi:hypothetical protein
MEHLLMKNTDSHSKENTRNVFFAKRFPVIIADIDSWEDFIDKVCK